jgi:integrase
MSKRGNGEGSIGQRPDGRWEARVVVGRTPKGNPKRRSVYGKTRKEVGIKLQTLLRDREDGKLSANATISTVAEYLEKYMRFKTSIEASTRQHYQNVINYYIVPHVGTKRLTTLKPLMIEEFMQALRDLGKGAQVIKHAYRVLNMALKQAVRWQIISSNPCDGVNPPPKPKSTRQVWDKENAAKFLESVKDHRLYALYLLVLVHGLRRGEVLGLRWADIDWDARKIRIEHTSIFIDSRRTPKDSPKSPSSKRSFTLAPEVIAALAERQGAFLVEKENAGATWQGTEYIFCSSIGTGLHASSLRKVHDILIVKAEVPRITLHELRHTYTSLALLAGVSVKEVSRRLGHATVELTQDTYQHLYPEQDVSGAISLAQILGHILGQNLMPFQEPILEFENEPELEIKPAPKKGKK